MQHGTFHFYTSGAGQSLDKLIVYKAESIFTVCTRLPVGGFKLRAKESVMEIESNALSSWCFLRHLWQTENYPGVDLSKTELPHQAEPVHGPETE